MFLKLGVEIQITAGSRVLKTFVPAALDGTLNQFSTKFLITQLTDQSYLCLVWDKFNRI